MTIKSQKTRKTITPVGDGEDSDDDDDDVDDDDHDCDHLQWRGRRQRWWK